MVPPHELMSNSYDFYFPHVSARYFVHISEPHEYVMFESDSKMRMSTQMIGAEEVAKALNTSKGYAYKMIRKLNAELEKKGSLVVKGKVSADHFAERFFGKDGGANVDQ